MMNQDIDILARTLYGEARGEYASIGIASFIAVGNVVLNRLAQKTWFGHTIQEVCQKPWQFSCWNKDDPNYPVILNVSSDVSLFRVCKDVSESLITNDWPDLSMGCDHYFCSTLKTPPSWTLGYRPRVQIGQHLFYKLGGKSL